MIQPEFVTEHMEKVKASIPARVEHPFRFTKLRFAFNTVPYRGLAKSTPQVVTLLLR